MKIIATVLLFSLSCGFTWAQKAKLDSLDRLIKKATTDTGRINLLNRKVYVLSENDIDAALKLGKEVIADARQLSYEKGEVVARTRLANNYNMKGDFAAARENLIRAERLVWPLNEQGLLSDVYSGYGMMYGMQSKYDSSIVFFDKAIRIGQAINHRSLSSYYQNIAIAYQMQSNYSRALSYQQKALAIAEQTNNINSQAYVLTNMGITYKVLGDFDRAQKSFFGAIKAAKTVDIKNVELYAYSNLATLFDAKKEYDLSYQYAVKSAELGKQLGDQGIEAASLAKAALAMALRTSVAQSERFARAETLAKQAIAIAGAARQPLVTYQVNAGMGTLLKMQGNCGAAIPYFEKGFQALTDSDIYDEQIEVSYQSVSGCYEQVGNYRRALLADRKATAIGDSIRNKENIRKTTELTLNYEFDKKQQLVRAERQQEAAIANTKQMALGGGLVLTLLLAGVAYNAYRSKQKANTLLEQQKEEIQRTLSELRNTQDQLVQREKMASLGELTAGVAHEIQNPLNFVNNFAELGVELIGELEDERQNPDRDEQLEQELLGDIKQNLQKIVHHGKRADGIVKSMLEHSRVSTGQKEPTDLNALADEYLRLAYHGLRAKDKLYNASLVTTFDSSLDKIQAIPQDLGRVLLNLFNNAFYATQEKAKQQTADYQPRIWVSTHMENGKAELRVKDNGTGIPESIVHKIYQPFFTTKPTGEGTGLGLSLSYDIVTKGHNGEMAVQTEANQFTEMIVRLPIQT
ncbi:Signal transduction histidine-protein kinase atoS [Fibrisoma limi BUZ 3]|uniref:histidine kinase n=1 Tax=Fibrisoma limi BUZ 3 TaxID=1185876 RepID=I2GKX2_9BACT|nr:tetratricopeptide repeat protein [Fibrisoma limi]CCH54548.1 Signal transduction histidine-protein kinase atoS [Fibrisoma limi BUZ 3]